MACNKFDRAIEERLKNEAEAYSNGIIPEARGKAQRVIEEANAYNRLVIAWPELIRLSEDTPATVGTQKEMF